MFKDIKEFTEAVLRKVGWLMRKLGLWVPALFCIAFFIVILITRTPFSSVKGMFLVGVIITTVIGVGLSILMMARKVDKKIESKKKQRTLTPEKKKKKGEKDVRIVEHLGDNDDDKEQKSADDAQSSSPPPQTPPGYYPPYPPQYSGYYPPVPPRPTAPTDNTPRPLHGGFTYPEMDRSPSAPAASPSFWQYPKPDDPNSYSSADFTPPNLDDQFGYSERRDRGYSERSEREWNDGYPDYAAQPKIYRTRINPDVLIHEYPDRLEYYRMNDNGEDELIHVDKKR